MRTSENDRMNNISRVLIMAIIWSWLWWTPRILATFEIIPLSPLADVILGVLGSLGPGLAAMYHIWRSQGKQAIAEFFKRRFKNKFSPILFIPAIIILPIIGAITTGVLVLTGLEGPWDYSLINIIELPVVWVILVSLLSAIGEEIGWRGFLQHELQGFINPFKVSLILGVFWGTWQLPLHFVGGTLQSGLSILQIILQSMALCVLFTWLYNKSGGSLLIAIVFHLAMSLTGWFFPIWAGIIGQWTYFLLMIISVFALGFIIGYLNYKKKN